MIACETFRARFESSTEDPAVLAHLRACDRCLDFAAHQDPDVMFRALGGEEMIPPGGIDAFVDDVMQQVRVRDAETTVASNRNVVSWPRRLAVAAMLAVTITGAAYTSFHFTRNNAVTAIASVGTPRGITAPVSLTTKPVVETYESDKATIIELPQETAGDDVKIVMIFDENLPADL